MILDGCPALSVSGRDRRSASGEDHR